MSLINAYHQVLSEGKLPPQAVKGFTHKVGSNIAGENKVAEKDPAKNADLDKPTEDKENSVSSSDGQLTKVKGMKENTDVFNALYEKIIAQENWEAEDEAQDHQDQLMFGPTAGSDSSPEDMMPPDSDGMGEELGEDEGGEDPMSEVLSALKAAVAALEKVVGGSSEEEQESEEGEEEGGLEEEGADSESSEGDEESEEEVSQEAVDAQELGTALVDLEKLAASLTNPKSQVVKGAVPVNKGKAQVPKGPKVDGTPTELKGDPEKLETKKNDTGGVRNGKGWYEQ